MPSRRIEQQLETLNELRHADSTESLEKLRSALADRVNIVVGKAAKIAAEAQAKALIPNLRSAFDRLFENPTKTDPQCWGKNAIAKALKDLECDEAAPFLRGIGHIQMEPIWGGEEDTAKTLRGTCALALPECRDVPRYQVMRVLVEALTDSAASVREHAAVALEQMGGDEASLLLRLKARLGDREPCVTGQVLESLLRLEAGSAVSFVSEFLAFGDEEVREEAALALGTSRLSDAIQALQEAWRTSCHIRAGEALLRGLSVSRQEEALRFLLEIVRDGRTRDAIEAIEALELNRGSEDICERLRQAVEVRGEASVNEAWRERFQRAKGETA